MFEIIENNGLIKVTELALAASTSKTLTYRMQEDLVKLYKKRNEFIKDYPYEWTFTLKISSDLR